MKVCVRFVLFRSLSACTSSMSQAGADARADSLFEV